MKNLAYRYVTTNNVLSLETYWAGQNYHGKTYRLIDNQTGEYKTRKIKAHKLTLYPSPEIAGDAMRETLESVLDNSGQVADTAKSLLNRLNELHPA